MRDTATIEYRVKVNVNLDSQVKRKLLVLAESRNTRLVTKSEAVNEALHLWLKDHPKAPLSSKGSQHPETSNQSNPLGNYHG